MATLSNSSSAVPCDTVSLRSLTTTWAARPSPRSTPAACIVSARPATWQAGVWFAAEARRVSVPGIASIARAVARWITLQAG